MDSSRLVSQNGFVLGATVLHDFGDLLRNLNEHAGSETPPHLVQLALAALPSSLRSTPTASPIPSFSQYPTSCFRISVAVFIDRGLMKLS